MRRIFIAILILFCIFLDSSATRAQADPASEIIQRVNALRAVYGVPQYEVDYALMYAAQAEAEWGLENKHFGHDGPGGSSPDDRAKAAGYGSDQKSFTIENVAAGTASLNTPELVVTMWQNDWGHLNAMISADYEHIGVGFAEADGFSFYVMMVGWVGSKASTRGGQNPEAPIVDPSTSTSGGSFILSEPDQTGAIYHVVQAGQSAWTIAAQYGIELDELFELNNLTEYSVLHPGDVLMIRPPDPATSTPAALPTSAATKLSSTIAPTQTAPPVQTTETTTATEILSTQNHQGVANEGAGSDISPISLALGAGLALLVGGAIILRLRDQ